MCSVLFEYTISCSASFVKFSFFARNSHGLCPKSSQLVRLLNKLPLSIWLNDSYNFRFNNQLIFLFSFEKWHRNRVYEMSVWRIRCSYITSDIDHTLKRKFKRYEHWTWSTKCFEKGEREKCDDDVLFFVFVQWALFCRKIKFGIIRSVTSGPSKRTV